MNSPRIPQGSRQGLALLLVALASIAFACWTVRVGPVDEALPEWIPAVLLYSALLLAWLAWWLASSAQGGMMRVVGIALIVRIILLLGPAVLSDDLNRYVFEGRMQWHGLSPFAFAPASPEAEVVRHEIPAVAAAVNHPEVAAAYPPGAQTLFWLITGISTDPLAVKICCGLADLLVALAVWQILRQRGQDPRWVALYLLHPVPLVEFWGSGHFDVLGIAAWMLALLFALRRRGLLCGLCLGLAIWIKFLPVVTLPFLLFQRGFPRRTFLAGLALATVLVVPRFAWLEGGLGWEGLGRYASAWEGSDVLYRTAFESLLLVRAGEQEPGSGLPKNTWDELAGLTRLGLVILAAGAMAVALFARAHFLVGSMLGIVLYLCISPVMHPWYLGWLVPLLVLLPSSPWLYLSFACFLAYQRRVAGFAVLGTWEDSPVVWHAMVAPVFVLLMWNTCGILRGRCRAAGVVPRVESGS